MTAHNCLYIFTTCLQQLLNFDNSNFWVYTTTSSNISHSNKNRVILINCANGIDMDLLTVLLHRKPHKHHFSQEKFQFQPLNQQPTTGDKCSFGVLGRLRVMGYTDLNCPEIPSRRRLADESPGQPTTMDNLPHAHHHPRNASNQWIPTIYQILIQTRITSQLCHKPAFSDGTYLNHQDYTTTFLSLYKIRYVKVLCTIKYQVYPTPHTHCHDNTGHFTSPCLQPTSYFINQTMCVTIIVHFHLHIYMYGIQKAWHCTTIFPYSWLVFFPPHPIRSTS